MGSFDAFRWRDEVGDPAVVAEHDVELRVDALVAERDLETAVEERHLAQALEQRLGTELDLVEDGAVGPERDRGAGASFGVADPLERTLRLTAVLERHLVATAVAADRQVETRRERVHHRHTDAVQAAGDLVSLATELAARVQRREHDLGGGLVGILGMQVDRDTSPVVLDAAPAVGEQRDRDARAVARHRLVDRVVDDLVDEVMQAGRTGGADVHTGALTNGFEAPEHRDVFGVVRHESTLFTCDDDWSARGWIRGSSSPPSGLRKSRSDPLEAVLQSYQTGGSLMGVRGAFARQCARSARRPLRGARVRVSTMPDSR